MVDNPKLSIGLNEAKFGMVAPPWLMDSYRACVGHNAAGVFFALPELDWNLGLT